MRCLVLDTFLWVNTENGVKPRETVAICMYIPRRSCRFLEVTCGRSIQYGSYHHDPVNIAIHVICVPMILITGFLFVGAVAAQGHEALHSLGRF